MMKNRTTVLIFSLLAACSSHPPDPVLEISSPEPSPATSVLGLTVMTAGFPRIVTYRCEKWHCEAAWYQYCRARHRFDIPDASLEYCKHQIDVRSLEGERGSEVSVNPRGVEIALEVKGSYKFWDQERGWWHIDVRVTGITRNTSASSRETYGCDPLPAPADEMVRVACIGYGVVPTGWVAFSLWNSIECPARQDGKKNAWLIRRYEHLSIGSVVVTCLSAPIPAGWSEVSTHASGACGGSLRGYDTRRIRRIS